MKLLMLCLCPCCVCVCSCDCWSGFRWGNGKAAAHLSSEGREGELCENVEREISVCSISLYSACSEGWLLLFLLECGCHVLVTYWSRIGHLLDVKLVEGEWMSMSMMRDWNECVRRHIVTSMINILLCEARGILAYDKHEESLSMLEGLSSYL